MANNQVIRVWDPIIIKDTEDGFQVASGVAKSLGNRRYCGFGIAVHYDGGNNRRVWCAYSNGVWTNCVDCSCMDELMQEQFINCVKRYAMSARLELGYPKEEE